jgi:hypothetical protein
MSWGTCYAGSNNIHFNYPPLMSDGRNYASWQPACDINNNLIKKSHIQTNYQYRQFLIKNADSVIKTNQQAACDQCGFCQYGNSLPTAPLGKYLYTSCSDASQPYGYETSDLKNMYLSRQALQSRLVAPLMSQQGYLTKPRSN